MSCGAQLFEDVGGLAAQVQGLRRKGRELQIRPLHVAVEKHHARKVDRAVAAKDLVLFEFEIHAQALDDFGIGAGFDLQANGVAFAAVVQLHADGFKQRARFFLFEVEVGIARDAERGVGQDFIAAIHAGEVLRDQILQQQVVESAVGGGQPDKTRQRARHRHHAEHLRAGTAPLGDVGAGQGTEPCSVRAETGGPDRWRWASAAGRLRAESSLWANARASSSSSSHSSSRMPCFRNSGSRRSFQQAYSRVDKTVDFGGE